MAFAGSGRTRWRRSGGLVLASAVALVTVAACVPVKLPVAPTVTVSADALPTVQINGVVWSQTTIGNVVYATGSFTSARPAGSRPGVYETPRNNLLAYDISNGGLIAGFAHSLNASGMVAARSPDGKRLYIGGDFTSVDGRVHNRIAAFNTATGQLVSSFAPSFNARVKAITATNSIVYVGGSFTSVNGVARTKLAAINPANGGLLGWKPTADNGNVLSMVITPDLQRVVIGGTFGQLNHQAVYGMAAVQALSGASVPWLANRKIHDWGPGGSANSGISSLTTDGKQIYGTGYVFGGGGNLEGAFAANPVNGAITWIEDCHGDSYDTYPLGNVVYAVSHSHFCTNIGGFPQADPVTFYRATAFTTYRTGTVKHNVGGPTYFDFYGNPAPSLLNWFPTLTTGTYTGQMQAAWSVTGNTNYISLGGEFPTVNGKAQQGLVRFAIRKIAPNKVGPRPQPLLTPGVTTGPGTVKLGWTATFDQDDSPLTYKIVKDGNVAKPIYTLVVNSTFWNEPYHTLTDTGLVSGSTHTYRIYVYDPWGNRNSGSTVTVVAR